MQSSLAHSSPLCFNRLANLEFSNPLWLCNASNLRQLANEFSQSPLRQQVRSRAQSVNLTTLNSANFSEMIQEIFQVSASRTCAKGHNLICLFSGWNSHKGKSSCCFLFLLRCCLVCIAKPNCQPFLQSHSME